MTSFFRPIFDSTAKELKSKIELKKLSSARLSSAQLGSARLSSTQLSLAQYGSAQLSMTQLNSTQRDSISAPPPSQQGSTGAPDHLAIQLIETKRINIRLKF